MQYLYLILALTSSLSIALMMRHFEHTTANRNVIIASNYISAGTIGFLLAQNRTASVPLYCMGAFLGLIFFVAFVTFSKAIKKKGIAGAVTMGRLSLAIPVAFSIFLWGEHPSIIDLISLLAIFAIIFSWEDKIGKPAPILIALFLLFGCADTLVKFFNIQFPETDGGFFLIIVYYSAMFWSWGYILAKKTTVTKIDVLKGLLLGIPNFFSTYFLILALQNIPAYIAFPFINVGTIIFSALLGYYLFNETLNKKRILLILMGILAVVCLTV